MDFLAPAGTPIGTGDLWRWLRALPRCGDVLEEFRGALTDRFGLAGCEFVSSGRAGMTLLLRTLHQLHGDPGRTEVIVPGYTCYSVPASVERAGLKVRVCDIHPATLSYDLARLEHFDFSRVLAVVSANLYGIPDDLPAIEALARRHGIFMVDDAAQCLGATCAGQAVGTFGDAGLFSLDKGKNITSMQGGILVTRSARIAAALRQQVQALPPPAVRDTLAQAVKMLAYAALLPPRRYGITRKLPFLGLGRTPYVNYSPLTQYSARLGVMAALLFKGLDRLTAQRRDNAERILETLQYTPGIDPVRPPPGSEPVYVRLPLLAPHRAAGDALIRLLESAGVGATRSYPTAVTDIPELRPRLDPRDIDCPGARRVADCLFTLPTHPYVQADHIRRMASAVQDLSEMGLPAVRSAPPGTGDHAP